MPATFDEDDQMVTPGSAIADLVATVGTADGTVADGGAAYAQGVTNDNNREFVTKINAILAALRDANIIPQD